MSLLRDMEIRWNSSYIKLKRFYDLKPAIMKYQEENELELFSAEDFSTIANYINLLNSFDTATKEFSYDNVTCSSIIPFFDILEFSLLSLNFADDFFQNLRNKIIIELKKRSEMYMKNTFLIIATCLDPRYKMKPISKLPATEHA